MPPKTTTTQDLFPRSVDAPDRLQTDDETRRRTRETLRDAAAPAEGILLSGGLDSSIAALLCGGLWTDAYCVTLPDNHDGPYARAVADRLGLELHEIEVTVEDLVDHVPAVAGELETFDPMRVRNAVVPYVALRRAADDGIATVVTGDGADELFAGYTYMRDMEPDELDAYRRHLAEEMAFSTPELADALGLEARSPFLEPPVRRLALDLDADDLVRDHAGRTWGKTALREAFADDLPEHLRWQRKDPIEKGSGSRALTEHYEAEFGDADLENLVEQARGEGVELRDAEHAAYYRAYRQTHPPPGEGAAGSQDRCEGCRAPLETRYCRVCGHAHERSGR